MCWSTPFSYSHSVRAFRFIFFINPHDKYVRCGNDFFCEHQNQQSIFISYIAVLALCVTTKYFLRIYRKKTAIKKYVSLFFFRSVFFFQSKKKLWMAASTAESNQNIAQLYMHKYNINSLNIYIRFCKHEHWHKKSVCRHQSFVIVNSRQNGNMISWWCIRKWSTESV